MNKRNYLDIHETVIHEKLNNGLQIDLIPKLDYHQAYVVLSINFGAIERKIQYSGNEFLLKSGLAHFLEHKMFEKTDGNYGDELSALGAEENAFTTYTYTAYQFTGSKNIEECIGVLFRMVSDLEISEGSIEKEKKIIIEEIHSYEDDYDYISYVQAVNNLYYEHPIIDDVCGDEESVQSITKADLELAFHLFYQPQNMHLVVVGNFNSDTILNAIHDSADGLQNLNTPVLLIHDYQEKEEVHKEYDHIEVNGYYPKVVIASKTGKIASTKEEMQEMMTAMSILSDLYFSKSSKIYAKWLNSGIINDSFSYDFSWGEDYSHFVVTLEGREVESFKQAYLDLLEHIEEIEISDEDFLLMKNKCIGEYIGSFNSLEMIGNNLIDITRYSIDLFDQLSYIRNITKEDVLKYRKYLKKKTLSIFQINP